MEPEEACIFVFMDLDNANNKKRFFISPLDWGLGHASRLVPIIHFLQKKGHIIFLGTNTKNSAFYQAIFPNIPQITIKGYGITYAKKHMIFNLILQIPRIKLAIFREYFQLKKIVNKHNIDTVISDSRFGLWNKKTKNYIISHQLQILYPRHLWPFGRLLNWTNKLLLNQFDTCLIPDSEDHLFSGLLSKNDKIKNQKFIGPLSRFSLIESSQTEQSKQLVFVLSGPEPQRSLFEDLIIDQLKQSSFSALLISGEPEKEYEKQIGPNIKKIAHLTDIEFAKTLKEAAVVFSRSGYSSIMDYAALQLKQVVLIPTPHQTEQEYLAQKLKKSKNCYSCSQKDFSLKESLENVKFFNGFSKDFYSNSPKNTNILIF